MKRGLNTCNLCITSQFSGPTKDCPDPYFLAWHPALWTFPHWDRKLRSLHLKLKLGPSSPLSCVAFPPGGAISLLFSYSPFAFLLARDSNQKLLVRAKEVLTMSLGGPSCHWNNTCRSPESLTHEKLKPSGLLNLREPTLSEECVGASESLTLFLPCWTNMVWVPTYGRCSSRYNRGRYAPKATVWSLRTSRPQPKSNNQPFAFWLVIPTAPYVCMLWPRSGRNKKQAKEPISPQKEPQWRRRQEPTGHSSAATGLGSSGSSSAHR